MALKWLAGHGDRTLGQWTEWTGKAAHVRRRLTPVEQDLVGAAVDLRGQGEARRRFEALRPALSPPVRDILLRSEEIDL